MKFNYDKDADVLYASLEGTKSGDYKELADGVYIRFDEGTGRPIGFIVVDYRRQLSAGFIKSIPHFPDAELPDPKIT